MTHLGTAMASPTLQAEVSAQAQQHPHWAVVTRVCNSQCFHSSARLRDFLFYVSDCALRNCAEEATEQHIGIHVFQRAPGYNSSEDSIVRTHARLLRQKLSEYFSTEGAEEDVVIEIPKGHYLPVFRDRNPQSLRPLNERPAAIAAAAPHIPVARKAFNLRRPWLALLLASVGVLLLGAGIRLAVRPNPVDRFWAPFLADNNTLVIYSNGVFVGDSTNGLKYAQPPSTQTGELPDNYVDTYTGIGEVASVYTLTQLFDRHRSHFVLKRSRLVTWDEAKLNDLVFIGSVAENPSLRVLPANLDFKMMTGSGYAGFINQRPKSSEAPLYKRPEHPLTKDYALIALVPGLQPGKKMLIFSGLTTLGTQAAVDFTCHRDTAEQLIAAASDRSGHLRPFEALLETEIGGGVPLESRLLAVHVH